MMLGLRTSIGMTNGKLAAEGENHWLNTDDFMAVEKYSFRPKVRIICWKCVYCDSNSSKYATLHIRRGVRTHLHMTFSIRLNSKTTLLWFLLTFEGYLVSTSTAFYPPFVEMRTSSNLSQMLNRINSFPSLMMANI